MIQTGFRGTFAEIKINELSTIKINELSIIIDIYKNSFDNTYEGHEKCLCNKLFNYKNKDKNNETDIMEKYLKSHYDNIKEMGKVYNNFKNDFKDIIYLIDYPLHDVSKSDNFTLYKKFNMIGYSNDIIFIFI